MTNVETIVDSLPSAALLVFVYSGGFLSGKLTTPEFGMAVTVILFFGLGALRLGFSEGRASS